MATLRKYASTLQLVLDDGMDEETGQPVYKLKSFNNVKTDATADQMYATANAFAGLQELSLFEIQCKDSSKIRNNE
ncbi:DUF1659 domain-containing protein [Lentibacillus sp. L22]|uniref:DUF1659 domain-containing protein n=1 Tax=Lentibacillus TaxID=175304 RepID=UPI0022B17544|nr:DUF1659 domain-containing protein [Lentibacillus daqui]